MVIEGCDVCASAWGQKTILQGHIPHIGMSMIKIKTSMTFSGSVELVSVSLKVTGKTSRSNTQDAVEY